MAAAVALQPPFRGRSVVRTLFLVPYALPAYAGILTWNFMLQRDTGAVNHVLVDNLGLRQSIPRDVYEAASVDGAGSIRQWRNITLPSLRPVNLVLVLVLFLWTFSDFNTPYVLFGTGQPPAGAAGRTTRASAGRPQQTATGDSSLVGHFFAITPATLLTGSASASTTRPSSLRSASVGRYGLKPSPERNLSSDA